LACVHFQGQRDSGIEAEIKEDNKGFGNYQTSKKSLILGCCLNYLGTSQYIANSR